jgi:hypothetical protein
MKGVARHTYFLWWIFQNMRNYVINRSGKRQGLLAPFPLSSVLLGFVRFSSFAVRVCLCVPFSLPASLLPFQRVQSQ